MKTINEIRKGLKAYNCRSAWSKGVNLYAFELLDKLEEHREYNNANKYIHPLDDIRTEMLNGAESWKDYSWGGSSLIYNGDIAARLCTPSEIKRTKGGELRPNKNEEWLDTQARALYQAYNHIKYIINYVKEV